MSGERAASSETQREDPPSVWAERAERAGPAPSVSEQLLWLQRTAGNRAVGRMLGSRRLGDAGARAVLARAPTTTRPVIPTDPTALEVRITKDATEYYISEFHHATEGGIDFEVEVSGRSSSSRATAGT